MRAEEDHRGGVVGDADGDCPLVPRGAAKSSLDVLNTDISETWRETMELTLIGQYESHLIFDASSALTKT